jgi:hypothetical protein
MIVRTFTRLFIVGIFLLPMVSSAQSSTKPSCFLTSSKDPSGQKTFDPLKESKEMQQYIDSGMLCPTGCYDIALTLTFQDATKVSAAIKAANKCGSDEPTKETADKLNRGCSDGQTHPAISIKSVGTVLKLPKEPKDRCDIETIRKISSGQGVSKTFALQSQLNNAISKVDTSTPEGRQQLGKILVNFGMDQSIADEKVADADKAADVQKQLQALVGSDADEAKKAADTLGLKLNDNLSDQSRLDPEKFKPVLSQEEYEQAKSYALPSTGFNDPNAGVSDLDRARCAISKNESGSCGGNYGLVGPPTRSGGRAYGRYQVMDFNIGPWSARACGVRMTPEQFRQSPDCQDKVFDQQFGSYMQQCGFEGAAAKWFSGRCAIGSGGDGYTSIGRYVAKALGTYNGSSFPFGSQNSIYAGPAGSPFSRVNPLGPSGQTQVVCDASYCYAVNQYAYTTTAPVGVPSGGVTGTTATTPVSTGVQGGTVQTPVQTTGTSTGNPLRPVATLIIQPQTVAHDAPFTVSWSSVGMRVDQMCRVLISTSTTPSLLAQQNDGSKTIAVKTPGDVKIDMNCLAMNGQSVSKSATVTVQ